MVNCAVCAMKSVPLAGFIGSWYFSCATRSLRKASLPSELVPPLAVCAGVEDAVDMVDAVVPLVGKVLLMGVVVIVLSLLSAVRCQ